MAAGGEAAPKLLNPDDPRMGEFIRRIAVPFVEGEAYAGAPRHGARARARADAGAGLRE
jgi:hypothetical protein